MGKKLSNIYIIFTTAFLVFFIPLVLLVTWAHLPVKKTADVVYYVAEGSSVTDVAFGLKDQNALNHPQFFKFYAKLMGMEKRIKSGTYVFMAHHSPADILNKLVNGESVKIKVSIPEGLNIYQIAEKLSDAFPQYPTSYWLGLMSDKNLLAMLPVGKISVNTLEGFLFPDTYFFDPNEKPTHVLQTFVLHFKQVVSPEMLAKANALGLNVLEYVTLASIVQKESSQTNELNEISGVFFNRLRINMRLQSDPTVIYGAWPEYRGKITKKHLRAMNQYNTYTKYVLPIGPIANPGLLSLQAVLNPTQSKNLYFVATGNGSHTFSESYHVHKKAVKRYIQHLRSSYAH